MTGDRMRAAALLAGLAVTAACASTSRPAELDQAQQLYQSLQGTAAAQRVEAELIRTEQAIQRADSALNARAGQAYVDQLAHIALRRAQVAEAENVARMSQALADSLRTVRLQRLLTMTQAQRDALAARNELSEQEIAALRQRNQEVQQRADSLRMVAEEANRRLNEALGQLRTLVVEITNLQQTQRGLVVSLSDVLFDVNKATLKPGAQANMQRIAGVLQQFPDYQIAVEGHTDATGPDDYNQRLSEQRAESVRQALIAGGVDATRITARGLGETQPIATNDTPAGRQQNRRVEIIVLGAGLAGAPGAAPAGTPPSGTPPR